jgi:hypothetical protein
VKTQASPSGDTWNFGVATRGHNHRNRHPPQRVRPADLARRWARWGGIPPAVTMHRIAEVASDVGRATYRSGSTRRAFARGSLPPRTRQR